MKAATVTVWILVLVGTLSYAAAQSEENSEVNEQSTTYGHRWSCYRFRQCAPLNCEQGFTAVYKLVWDYWRLCRDCGTCQPETPNCAVVRCAGVPPGCTKSIIPPGQCCPQCVDSNPILIAPCENNADRCLPVRPDCPDVRPGPIREFLEQQCTGCPTCAVPQDCSTTTCPPITSDCPRIFSSNAGCCPVCVRPCPALLCIAVVPNCPNDPATRSVTISNGQLCTGCLTCPDSSCPQVACLKPDCNNPIPTTVGSIGPDGGIDSQCASCPECPTSTIQCITTPCP